MYHYRNMYTCYRRTGVAPGVATSGTPAPTGIRPPPAIPLTTRPKTTTGPAAYLPGAWTEVVKRKLAPALASRAAHGALSPLKPTMCPAGHATPPPSPSLSAIPVRDRHITLCFTTRHSIALLAGCSKETIRTRMNVVFTNTAWIGKLHLYLKEVR